MNSWKCKFLVTQEYKDADYEAMVEERQNRLDQVAREIFNRPELLYPRLSYGRPEKRNFDTLDGFGFGKRSGFDPLEGIGFGKRSQLDSLNGFGFGKRMAKKSL